MTYKTPGVYVKEISIFPPSVAEVETAIPAFIGYTEKAEKKGESLINIPTRISSLLEYVSYFGGAFEIPSVNVKVDENNNYAVSEISISSRYYMYNSLRLFFDNGGGNCYIISVGLYHNNLIALGDETVPDDPGFLVGLHKLKNYDEPTIILFPDAVLLPSADDMYMLQKLALEQCNKLQDRVSVFDITENNGWLEGIEEFRNNIGINNLKYGAAYTPWLYSTYAKEVDFRIFKDHVTNSGDIALNLSLITSDSNLNNLVLSANTAVSDIGIIESTIDTLLNDDPSIKDHFRELKNEYLSTLDNNDFINLLNYLRQIAVDLADWANGLKGLNLLNDLNSYVNQILKTSVHDLIAFEKNPAIQALSGKNDAAIDADYNAYEFPLVWLIEYDDDDDDVILDDILSDGNDYSSLTNLAVPAMQDIFDEIMLFIEQISDASATHSSNAQKILYENHTIISNMVNNIKKEMAKLPPSGAVVGVYAKVDHDRGVWKSPANVSLNSVSGVTEFIDDNEQESLNVDVNAGKSINAIRTFTGRGILVWGARTMAGNDNEWRYIAVRRFFNMVEESVKKSTGWAVFEPNDANTWNKVRGMIEGYLYQKWQEGALQGAKPDEAYFVKVGLGLTMTQQDVLEGRMIVEIGMAVVRPAEFIILKFSHKMIES
jgi:phage tail sheath protein FI